MTLQISAFTASGYVTTVPLGSESIVKWKRMESIPFTKGEDRRIISLRGNGKKWRQIAKSLNRPIGSVQGRYTRLMY